MVSRQRHVRSFPQSRHSSARVARSLCAINGNWFPTRGVARTQKILNDWQSGLAYADAKKQGAVLGWGQFLTVALNFLIIAGVLFLAIKAINKLKKEEPPVSALEPTPEVKLLTEIRDLLKQ